MYCIYLLYLIRYIILISPLPVLEIILNYYLLIYLLHTFNYATCIIHKTARVQVPFVCCFLFIFKNSAIAITIKYNLCLDN